MQNTSPILSLPLIEPAQAQKHVTHNEALKRLDAVVQLVVEDRDRTAPPATPQAGQRHIVAGGGTGDWAGHDGEIAVFDGTAWWFAAPAAGWHAEILGEGRGVVFDGTVWQVPALNDLDGLGINATADATNRLALASPASLFSHEGSDHRVKINKAQGPDTASLVFQTAWSGRAEMGLSGSDAWSIKVSPDGTSWTEALRVDPANGIVTGAAVQAAREDVTPGRLMRADYGYGPGNLLGLVAQAAGLPTGAAMERGSTANGQYMRLADGTQICTHMLDFTLNAFNNVTATWTFPVSFAETPNIMAAAPNSGSNYINCGASQMGLFRQGGGTTSAGLTFTGLVPLSAGARVDAVRVTAIGRWF